MKKNKALPKVLACVLTVMILMTVLAVPVSARTYRIEGLNFYLNLYGNSGMSGRKLSLWTDGSGKDQQFEIRTDAPSGTSYTGLYMFNTQTGRYVVNRNSSTNAAWMYNFVSDCYRDSMLRVSKPTNTYEWIYLIYGDAYLTPATYGTNTNYVYWYPANIPRGKWV